VRAYSPETAAEVAALLEELAPRVRAILGAEERPVTAWGEREHRLEGGAYGLEHEYVIRLADMDQLLRTLLLGHELAHWYMRDTPWMRFPPAIWEGLAEYVGTEAIGPWAYELRRNQARPLGVNAPWALRLSHKEVLGLDGRTGEALQLWAFKVVDQVGFEKLRKMAVAGRVSVDDLLEAADLRRRGEQVTPSSPAQE
jgi:hypothetical protein